MPAHPSIQYKNAPTIPAAKQMLPKRTHDGETDGDVNQGVKKIATSIVTNLRATKDKAEMQRPKAQ